MSRNATLFRLENLTRALISSRPELKEVSFKTKNDQKEFGYFPTPEYTVIRISEILTALKAESICDLGCGTGLLLAQLQVLQPDLKVMGIENEEALINFSHNILDLQTVFTGDLLKMNLSNQIVRNCNVFYMWEPIHHPVVAKDFVIGLTEWLKPKDIIIYQSSGKIGDFLTETQAYKRCKSLQYKEPFDGRNKKGYKTMHFATNQLFVFEKKITYVK